MRAYVLAVSSALTFATWLAPAATAQDEWKTATFAAPVDSVYHAAEIAVAKKHEVKSNDPDLHIIRPSGHNLLVLGLQHEHGDRGRR